MKKGRRLLVMAAGIMAMCGSSLPWPAGAMPINTSFGELLSQFLSTISGGAVLINLAALDQISMAAVLFVIGVIILASAVLGSKPVALIGVLLLTLAIAMWLMNVSINFADIFTNFANLGLGTQLTLGGTIITLLAIIFPRIKRPAKPTV